jgi:hypothetical protein
MIYTITEADVFLPDGSHQHFDDAIGAELKIEWAPNGSCSFSVERKLTDGTANIRVFANMAITYLCKVEEEPTI